MDYYLAKSLSLYFGLNTKSGSQGAFRLFSMINYCPYLFTSQNIMIYIFAKHNFTICNKYGVFKKVPELNCPKLYDKRGNSTRNTGFIIVSAPILSISIYSLCSNIQQSSGGMLSIYSTQDISIISP